MPNKTYVNRYRLWCNNDNQYEYSWSTSEPTVCPRNNTHNLDVTKTTVIQRVPGVIVEASESPYKYKKGALVVDNSTGSVTIVLKTVSRVSWPIIVVKPSAINNIYLTTPDGATIDGAPTLDMSQIGCLVLESNGTSWTSTFDYDFRTILNESEIKDLSNVINGDGKGDLLVDDGEELTYLDAGGEGSFLQIYNASETGVRWTNITGLSNSSIDPSAQIDVLKLGTGMVNNTEFSYLNGASDNLQTQINNLDNSLATHITDYSNPHEVTKVQIGLGNVENLLHNLSASLDPNTNDDGNSGYSIGSHWLNTIDNKVFVCLDASVGVASWIETSPTGLTGATNLGSGSGGVGIYSGISDSTLEMKGLVSTNNLLTVTDNSGNGTLELTVNESNFNLGPGGSTVAFDAYYNQVDINDSDDEIGFTFQDVPLDVKRFSSGHFTHSNGSADVTFTSSGTYLIQARCTTYMTNNSSRTTSYMRLALNSGSGWSEVDGSYATMYNRTRSQGYNTGHVSLIISISSGDRVKIQVAKLSGSSSSKIKIMSEACSLTAVKI